MVHKPPATWGFPKLKGCLVRVLIIRESYYSWTILGVPYVHNPPHHVPCTEDQLRGELRVESATRKEDVQGRPQMFGAVHSPKLSSQSFSERGDA